MKNLITILIFGVGMAASTAFADSLKKGATCSAPGIIIQDNTEFACLILSSTERLTISKIYQLGWQVKTAFYIPDSKRISLIIEEQKNE